MPPPDSPAVPTVRLTATLPQLARQARTATRRHMNTSTPPRAPRTGPQHHAHTSQPNYCSISVLPISKQPVKCITLQPSSLECQNACAYSVCVEHRQPWGYASQVSRPWDRAPRQGNKRPSLKLSHKHTRSSVRHPEFREAGPFPNLACGNSETDKQPPPSELPRLSSQAFRKIP